MIRLSIFFLMAGSAHAAVSDMQLKWVQVPPIRDLTTEKVWEFEPEEKNPARSVLALERRVRLASMRAFEMTPDTGEYYLQPGDLEVFVSPHLRADLRWYRPLAEFPCTPNRGDSLFYTDAGAQSLVQEALKGFEAIARKEFEHFKKEISGLHGASGPDLILLAERKFEIWEIKVTQEWMALRARLLEGDWKDYRLLTASACKSAHTALPLESPVERPVGVIPRLPLVHAPIKKNKSGEWTVRVNVELLNVRLSGNFLIDLETERSLISPTFLEAQGFTKEIVDHLRIGAGQRQLLIDSVAISNLVLPIQTVEIAETRFDEKGCCDGVLGEDLFRAFVVQFEWGSAPHLNLWAKAGFELGLKAPWVEVRSAHAHWVSACENHILWTWETDPFSKKPSCLWDEWKSGVPEEGTLTFDIPHGRVWWQKPEQIPSGPSSPTKP